MRVLGIDCGSARTGYGVIESDGQDHRMLAAGLEAEEWLGSQEAESTDLFAPHNALE